MVHYLVTETIGKSNPDLGIPNAQPGSVEYKKQYIASRDLTLSPCARAAAAAQEAAAEASEMQDAAEMTRQTGEPPTGFVVLECAGRSVSTSAGLDLGNGQLLVRDGQIETMSSHGFRPVKYRQE